MNKENHLPVLRIGSTDKAVLALRVELARVGLMIGSLTSETFDEGLRIAVENFQKMRGLRVDGICGRQTWAALEETQHILGDRLLALRNPFMRGDDIAHLQTRLNALGFDSGKVDGIFGPLTEAALTGFQRNSGLSPDGIFGKNTAAAFDQLGLRPQSHLSSATSLGSIKEQESLRTLSDKESERKIVIAATQNVTELARNLGNLWEHTGTQIEIVLLEPSDSSRASERANKGGSSVVISLESASLNDTFTIAYYSGFRYVSSSGKSLALLIESNFQALGKRAVDTSTVGMATPILRETRMPAVHLEVPYMLLIGSGSDEVALVLYQSTNQWFESSTLS